MISVAEGAVIFFSCLFLPPCTACQVVWDGGGGVVHGILIYFSDIFFFFCISEWLKQNGHDQDFTVLSEEDLGKRLKSFYAEARNKDGELYAKSSMMCIRAAIQRFLQGPPHDLVINIMCGPAFVAANNVIQGAIKLMRRDGLDKSTRYQPISLEHLQQIYSSGAFNPSTPTTLQLKTFFEVTLHLVEGGGRV